MEVKTSKMNFANNRLTNLRIFYTNFSSFKSFMVGMGMLQTLTRVTTKQFDGLSFPLFLEDNLLNNQFA